MQPTMVERRSVKHFGVDLLADFGCWQCSVGSHTLEEKLAQAEEREENPVAELRFAILNAPNVLQPCFLGIDRII
jgi:hypothetical protein